MLGVFSQQEIICNMRMQEQAPVNMLLMDRTIKEWNNKKQQNDERSLGYKVWEALLELLDDVAWEIEGYSVNPPREVFAKAFRIATLPIVVATAVPAIVCEVVAKVQQE